jgi:outer membrane receptor protein involved in Fe transport
MQLGGQWQAVARADYAWQDQVFFDFFNHEALVQGSHGRLNLAASLETVDAKWQISVFARNAMDERYLNHARVVDGAPAQLSGTVGAPRVYGIGVAYQL